MATQPVDRAIEVAKLNRSARLQYSAAAKRGSNHRSIQETHARFKSAKYKPPTAMKESLVTNPIPYQPETASLINMHSSQYDFVTHGSTRNFDQLIVSTSSQKVRPATGKKNYNISHTMNE